MKKSTTSNLKIKETSAWFLTPFLMLIMNPSHVLAQAYETFDGAVKRNSAPTFGFIGNGSQGKVTDSYSYTNFTNFFTGGGNGSGGGAGMGGVFFVDQNATLNLNNVQISSNVARGGTGGSLPQFILADLAVNLTNLAVDITSINAPGSTPTIKYEEGAYKVSAFTMSAANPLIAAGANVSVGSSTGKIKEVSGSTIILDAPITVARSAQLTGTVSGQSGTTVTVTANSYGYSEVAQGMVVYGDGIPVNTTITSVTVDSTNGVKTLTLSKAPTSTNVAFDVIGVTSFDVTRFSFSPLAPNQIKPTAQLAGLQVGMEVTGAGFQTGTKITNIASDGVITLSKDATGVPTAFKASLTAAKVGEDTITLLAPRSDLAVDMTVTGEGISGAKIIAINPDKTTLTLDTKVQQSTIDAIAAGTMLLSSSPVLASTSNTITLSSVAGLKVNGMLKGTGIPDNAVITGINPTTKVVTYKIDATAASLQTGGAMNIRTATGSVGSNGAGGSDGSMYNAIMHDGEGEAGTNAYNAGDGSGAAGGKGGNGGNGSRGIPFNMDNFMDLTTAIAGAVKDSTEGAAALSPDPLPDPVTAAAKFASFILAWVDVARITADTIKWQIDLDKGLVARGGDGGAGGSGGNGSDFFGGGAGGRGGDGGAGAKSITAYKDGSDGGAGGDGGGGGAGGFGAGGGAGGKGGTGGANGSSVNGGAGDGGEAGFGAGVGSNGDGKGGGGGSGLGGAIFVREGGTLNITGNALFENNAVLAGSSTNGGSAGEAAGTDLFMMRGSAVTLTPGISYDNQGNRIGNTITFRGTIADNSAASIGGQWASGEGADIKITGGGLVQFEGANTYTGKTMIEGGTLQAADGVGIHTDSQIFFNGSGTIGTEIHETNAGVLLTSGDFVRRVGDLPHQVIWAGSGGFAAEESGLTLNFGAIGNSYSQTLVWDQGGFVPDGKTLVFGSPYGTGAVTLLNDVDLNEKTGRIAVYDNMNSANDFVVLKGKFFKGSLIFNDADYAGTTYMTGKNSLTSLMVQNGVVDTQYDGVTGQLFDSGVGGALSVTGGRVNLRGAEKITSLSVDAQGSVFTYGQLTTDNINNTGVLALNGGTAEAPNVVGDVTNAGQLWITSATSAQNVTNSANLYVASNMNVAGGVANNGTLTVLGDFQSDISETSATRTITTTTFSGSGEVKLGGMSGMVNNTLAVDQSGDSTYAGVFTGKGSLLKQGKGTLTLTGASTFTGGLTIDRGAIDTTGGGTLADTLDVKVGERGAYRVGTADTINSLTNAGDTTLAANLTVLGDTENSQGGTFTVNSGVTAELKRNLYNPGTLRNDGTLNVTGLTTNTSHHSLDLMAGSVTQLNRLENTGTVTANGSSFTAGPVQNNTGGIINLNAGTNRFGSLSGTGGVINLNSTNLTINQTVAGTYSGAVYGTGSVTVPTTGPIVGTGILNKYGAATLTLNSETQGSFAPTALNINQGGVAVDGTGILASALHVYVATGANLTLVSGDQSINDLNGTGTLNVNANNLTLANGGYFTGNVTGSGAVKVTNGAFTVAAGGSMGTTGAMNVTGANSTLNAAGTVNASSLNVNNGGTLHVGAVGGAGGTVNTNDLIVSNGGSLTGVGTIRGAGAGRNLTAIRAGGTLAPGNSPGMLTVDGDLSIESGSVTNMQVAGLAAPGAVNGYDQVIVTGALMLKPGSTLNLQKDGFEFGLGQKAQIFAFAPGAVSGYFGSASSNFTKSVIYNVPTGAVIGLGDYTATTFTNAISATPNQTAIAKAMMVNSAGGVNQYYGGRLMEYVTAALAPTSGTTVKQAFDKWSPEAYTSMMDHMKFSMLNNMPELGGYTNLAAGKYNAFGSVKRLGQTSDSSAGYVQSKYIDNNVNVGLAYQSTIGQFTFAYGHSDGSMKSNYLKGSGVGDKITMGASLPIGLTGSLRATARAMFGTYAMSGTRDTNQGRASFGTVRGNAVVYGPGLEFAKDFGNVRVNATTEVLGMTQSMPGFTERNVNDLDAMSVHEQNNTSASVKGDLKLGYMINQDSLAYIKAGVTHQADNNMRNLTANAKSDAANIALNNKGVFTVQNPGLGATQFNLGLGANVYMNKKALFSVDMMRGTGGLSNIDLSFKYLFD